MLFFLCGISTLHFFVSVALAAHTIRFFNYCGTGTPTIVTHSSRTSLDGGATYSSANDDDGVIYTFLEQGSCGNDGKECTTVNIDLTIPEASISQTNNFSVPLSLQYSCANNSTHFAQCYFSNCDPTPILCDSFDSELIVTFCPLGSPSITKPSSSPSSPSTFNQRLIVPIIVVVVILVIALASTILFLRRKSHRQPRMDTESGTASQDINLRPPRPERTSVLTVPSYHSTRAASTISKESWQDFKSGNYFVKLYPTESEMSTFED